MILKLAARFIRGNRTNSLIITVLIIFITSVFFTGNTLLFQSFKGLKESYVNNFTGSIVIHAESAQQLSIFGVNNPAVGEFYSIPVVKNLTDVESLLLDDGRVEGFTHQLTGFAALDINGRQYSTLLFGVDGSEYFSFFDKIELLSGSLLETGAEGIMLSQSRAAQIEAETGRQLEPGAPVLLSSIGSMGFRIREVPLSGIYRFRQNFKTLQDLAFTDASTLRALNSVMIQSSDEPAPEDSGLLDGSEDLDDLFTDFGDFNVLGNIGESGFGDETGGVDLTELNTELSKPKQIIADSGSWNFILVKLAPGANSKGIIEELNTLLKPFNCRAIGWRDAAGQAAMITLLLQILFNTGCALIMAAGIIAIINIFLISVFRRTADIGTLRSLGATDADIRGMLYLENLMLTGTGGGLGVLLSLIVMSIINSRHIKIDSALVSALLGQSELSFTPSAPIIIFSLVLSIIIGWLSSLYPVRSALVIEPVSAMREGGR